MQSHSPVLCVDNGTPILDSSKTLEGFRRRHKILRAISKTFYIFMKLARINRISIHWGSEEN